MTDKIIAISAIVISVSALVVSVYEATLMRKAQRAATWPYIEILPDKLNNEYFALKVNNTGVGPARIKDFKITLDGFEMDEKTFRDSLVNYLGNNVGITWSTVSGRVLPAEKKITFLKFSDTTAYWKVIPLSRKMSISLCYCSVFDQCWISNGLEQTAVKNCD